MELERKEIILFKTILKALKKDRDKNTIIIKNFKKLEEFFCNYSNNKNKIIKLNNRKYNTELILSKNNEPVIQFEHSGELSINDKIKFYFTPTNFELYKIVAHFIWDLKKINSKWYLIDKQKKESDFIKEEYFFRMFEQNKDYLEWEIIKLAGTIKNDKTMEKENKKNEILKNFLHAKSEEILNIKKR